MQHFGVGSTPGGQLHYGNSFFSKAPLSILKNKFGRRRGKCNHQFTIIIITAPGAIIGNAVFYAGHWAIVIGRF